MINQSIYFIRRQKNIKSISTKMSRTMYNLKTTRSTADAEGPCVLPQIRNIALEKDQRVTDRRTDGHTSTAYTALA